MTGGGVSRRELLVSAAAAVILLAGRSLAAVPEAAIPFSFELLTSRMAEMARAPVTSVRTILPEALQHLGYDVYRMIQPRGDRAVSLANGLGYHLQPFHLGWLYTETIDIYEVKDSVATTLSFGPQDFYYRDPALARWASNAELPGVAGFRLSYPVNEPDRLSEFASFLGSSYFRAIGGHNVYGASARAVALNTWTTQPEEFPRFTAFYIEPGEAEAPITVYASLEGESLTGAFRFVFDPAQDGGATVADVTARFFFRKDVGQLGIAPLTSMFLYASANRARFDDYRPQVHDSDGLWLKTADGEVSWRALNNPPQVANSYLSQAPLATFGLLQRDREFEHYQDDEARYDLRPSVVVEPSGDWGKGMVRLIEVPSSSEAEDNVIAFWMPEASYKAGDSAEFSYRLRWGDLPLVTEPLAPVVSTRAGRGGFAGVENPDALRKFVIDFKGSSLAEEAIGPRPIDAVVTLSDGKLMHVGVMRLPGSEMIRLSIDAEIVSVEPVELRAYLVARGRQLTETWLYQWRTNADISTSSRREWN